MKKLLRVVLLFSMVINLLWLAPAMFSLQVFDRVLTSRSNETLLVLMVGVFVAFLLTGGLEYLRGRLQGVMGNIVNDAMAPEVAKLTLAEAAKRQGPLPMEALRDVARLRALFSAQGLLAVLDAPWAIVYLLVISMAHPLMGLAALAAMIVMVVVAVVNDRMTRSSIEKLQKEAGQAQRYLEQAMQNAEVAQALGMGEALVARWKQLSTDVAMIQAPTARRSVAMSSFTRVLRQAIQILLQGLGAYLVLEGQATPGVLVASTVLLGKALQPIEQIVASWRVLAEGRLAYRRLNPMMEKVVNKPVPMALPAPKGVLAAAGVVFRPPNSDRTILSGVSLHLEAGESLAILGPSGAGKSTLVRVLLGLWAPMAGVVRLDGVDLSKWDREAVGPHIGYVPQDVELFNGTVSENIARLGPVEASTVVEAAKLARVHEMILSLPQGYDTVIDSHAALLSPGQRQRLALARALYGHPKLLVLDEPNSNLDGSGELALAETLKEIQGRTTVIVVTHRTALTAHVDKMMVLDGGRATHYGPAKEVLNALQNPKSMPLSGNGLSPGVSMTMAPRAAPDATAPAGSAPAPAAVPVAATVVAPTQTSEEVAAAAAVAAGVLVTPTSPRVDAPMSAQPPAADPDEDAEVESMPAPAVPRSLWSMLYPRKARVTPEDDAPISVFAETRQDLSETSSGKGKY